MTEFDFDELDRAVNSLIAGNNAVPKSSALSTEEDTTIVIPENLPAETPATATSAAPAPVTPTPAPVTAEPAAPTTPAAPLATKRSTGRFMDVVHPSSDMRTPPAPGSTIDETPSEPEKEEEMTVHRGLTIAPISPISDIIPPPVPVVETKPEDEDKEIQFEAPKNDWPDPIAFSGFTGDEPTSLAKDEIEIIAPAPIESSVPAVSEDDDIDKIANDISNSLAEPTEPETLSSPFLPDAKVAKRPLGAFSDTPAPVAPIAPVTAPVAAAQAPVSTALTPNLGSEEEVSDPSATNTPADDDQSPLPAELQSDLLSIESGTAKEDEPEKTDTPIAFVSDPQEEKKSKKELKAEAKAAEAEAKKEAKDAKEAAKKAASEKPALVEAVVDTPKETSVEIPASSEKAASATSSAAIATLEVPAGPVAISQQYKETPSTGDTQSGSIYDTDTYHKALSHPAKKKSGAWVILWIVLLIIVGAAVGAAVYYFVLPHTK